VEGPEMSTIRLIVLVVCLFLAVLFSLVNGAKL